MPIYNAEEYDERHGHEVEKFPLPTDCATSNYPRLIHDGKTWMHLQTIYHDEGYGRKSYHHQTVARYKDVWYSGIDNEYAEPRDNGDGRGRGMYAVRDIPKGTRIWDTRLEWIMNEGFWKSKEKMLDFLQRLPHDLQCDVLLWAFASTETGGNGEVKKYVECNLDEASFFNHAERAELINIHGVGNVATRDIKKGEELLMDYGTFISLGEESIPWWDEIRNTAWKASEYKEIATDIGDSDTTSETNNSKSKSSSSSASSHDAIDGYVKYGAPKSMSTGSMMVDAHSIHGAQATNHDFLSTLAGVGLACVLTRSFVMMGMRRRR